MPYSGGLCVFIGMSHPVAGVIQASSCNEAICARTRVETLENLEGAGSTIIMKKNHVHQSSHCTQSRANLVLTICYLCMPGPHVDLFFRKVTFLRGHSWTQVNANILRDVKVGSPLVVVHLFDWERNQARSVKFCKILAKILPSLNTRYLLNTSHYQRIKL